MIVIRGKCNGCGEDDTLVYLWKVHGRYLFRLCISCLDQAAGAIANTQE